MKDLLKDLSRVSYDLLIQEPFFGQFFVGFVKIPTERKYHVAIRTSAEFVEFQIETDYWFAQNEAIKKGLLKHELLHLVYKHPFRCKDYLYKNIAFLAADLVVNQELQSDEIPADAFTLQSLEVYDLILEKDKNLRYYYEGLMERYHELQKIQTKLESCDGGQGSYSDQYYRMLAKDKDNADWKKGLAQRSLFEKLDQRTYFNSHQTWRSFDSESESKNGMMEHNIDHLLVNIASKLNVSNSWGRMSAGLKSYLQNIELYKAQKVDWKKALKIFVASSQKTYLKTTISRPSKRYGTTPGIKLKRHTKMCVVIDTSGSLSDKELTRYFNEIYHIWKQNTEIMIVECDVRIHRTYMYKGQKPDFVMGRGGTNFNAPIQFNNEEYKGDALVYLTDGFAETPQIKSRVPIFWLIYGKETDQNKELPGRVVHMD